MRFVFGSHDEDVSRYVDECYYSETRLLSGYERQFYSAFNETMSWMNRKEKTIRGAAVKEKALRSQRATHDELKKLSTLKVKILIVELVLPRRALLC